MPVSPKAKAGCQSGCVGSSNARAALRAGRMCCAHSRPFCPVPQPHRFTCLIVARCLNVNYLLLALLGAWTGPFSSTVKERSLCLPSTVIFLPNPSHTYHVSTVCKAKRRTCKTEILYLLSIQSITILK